MLNPAYSPLANPFGRGYPRRIGQIHRYYAVVGANGTTMVMMFVGGVVLVSMALSVIFCTRPKVFCYRLNFSEPK